MNSKTINKFFIFRYSTKSIRISILTALVVFWSVPSFAQLSNVLKTQLQQAVDSRDWSQAIQIIDRMIISEPAQATKLKTYRAKLRELSTEIKQPLFSPLSVPNKSYRRQQEQYTFSFSDVELIGKSFGSAGNLYYLIGSFFNKSSKYIKAVTVYFTILHYFTENNSSGSFVMLNIPANKSQNFEELLSRKAYPSLENILIRKVEWIDEEGNRGVDNSPKRFQVYSNPRIIKAN